jgi:hypothetical protein
MRRLSNRSATIALLGASILLNGCTFADKMADQAIQANEAVQRANTEMLLLNILRARDQRPMAFTALKGLSITAKAQTSVSFATPFGQAATHSYSVSPSLTGTAQPSFDIAVLSDKEFTKAIHTPVSAETLGLFLRQGWPARVLLHVFVERLEKPSEVSIENRAKSIEAFAKEVAKIGRNPVVSAGKSSYTQIGLSLSPAELKENRHLLKQTADLGAKKLQLLACDVARRRAGNTSNPNPSAEACPPDE